MSETLTPEKLVSDITQQNEALNKIIQKFSEPKPGEDKPDIPKHSRKSKNK